ncbi:MAG: sporulation control protein Spo0M, partial [Pseudoalteromonas sp.]|nr:sporulation control protein Spo0M [Pseudoalteromonas sp.]
MFKKILASVGIGAAKVDTILETEHLYPGQKFQAQ